MQLPAFMPTEADVDYCGERPAKASGWPALPAPELPGKNCIVNAAEEVLAISRDFFLSEDNAAKRNKNRRLQAGRRVA